MTILPPPASCKLQHQHGLLIEDSPTFAEFFSLSLRRITNDAFSFTNASTLEQAEQLMAGQKFDIVVVDLGLPDADGLETAERTIQAAGDTPVVVLTAVSDYDIAVQAVELGAQDFLPKGSAAAMIARSLSYAITRKQHELQLRRMRKEAAEVEAAHRQAAAKAQLYEELREALTDADAAKAAKEQFMTSVTHELRTPLHGVISFARLGATQYGVADRQRLGNYFRNIEASGQLLLTLVSDLLDLSKLESGQGELQLRNASLEDKLCETSDEFYPMLVEKNVSFQIENADARHCSFDVRLIKQLIRNLLSNALKFTPAGSTISAGIEYNDGNARIWVADEGCGIPEAETETIFDKFMQSSVTPCGTTGTGLGLTICREIVRAHQGRIWAENRVGGGAIFFAEFPAAEATLLV